MRVLATLEGAVPSRLLILVISLICCLLPALQLQAMEANPHTAAISLIKDNCVHCHGKRKQKGGLRLDSRDAILRGGHSGAAAVAGNSSVSLLIRSMRHFDEPHMPPDEDPLDRDTIATIAKWVEAGLPWPGQSDGKAAATKQAPEPGRIAFEKNIKPILQQHCWQCHGSNDPAAGLSLTTRAAMMTGGRSGPAAIAGDPAGSLLIKAINHQGSVKMPAKSKKKLDEKLRQALWTWIEQGAMWPVKGVSVVNASGTSMTISEADRQWWSFRPVSNPPVPRSHAKSAPSAIDGFIAQRLAEKGLQPAPLADKATLLRRLSYNLTGLPPSPKHLQAFLADTSAKAYEKQVDRLLASADYGQHWASWWMDAIRFADADSGTKAGDKSKPYRSWLIRSFNKDLPYDQFVRLQIAGDLLAKDMPDKDNPDYRIATAVLAMGVWNQQDTDKNKTHADIIDTQIDVVGRNFMGLTLACARCHDHKFDPISSHDYYALAGIFRSSQVANGNASRLVFPAMGEKKRVEFSALKAQIKALQTQEKELKVAIKKLEQSLKSKKKSDAQVSTKEDVKTQLAEKKSQIKKTQSERKKLESQVRRMPHTIGIKDGASSGTLHRVTGQVDGRGIGDGRVYIRGSYKRQGVVVSRGFPKVLLQGGEPSIPANQSGRKELAYWLTMPSNPLTARVVVNRVWQNHFGQGLVRTAHNFGKLGEQPSHPLLLDHLASTFMQDGWSLKKLHKRIVMSHTWRQSSKTTPAALLADPENRLLAYAPRRRLTAEEILDTLRLHGLGGDRSKLGRAVHRTIDRQGPPGLPGVFDAADPSMIIARRTNTISAQQSLFFMNAKEVDFAVGGLVKQTKGLRGPFTKQASFLMSLLYGRPATADEATLFEQFSPSGKKQKHNPLIDIARSLILANEFIYLD